MKGTNLFGKMERLKSIVVRHLESGLLLRVVLNEGKDTGALSFRMGHSLLIGYPWGRAVILGEAASCGQRQCHIYTHLKLSNCYAAQSSNNVLNQNTCFDSQTLLAGNIKLLFSLSVLNYKALINMIITMYVKS